MTNPGYDSLSRHYFPRFFALSAIFLGGLVTTSDGAPISYQSAVIADSPYAYFRLGEASGTAADNLGSSGSGATLDGKFVGGPTLGAAGFNGGDTAAGFSGSGQYLNTGSAGGNLNSPSPYLGSFGAQMGDGNGWSLEFIFKSNSSSSTSTLFGTIDTGTAGALSLNINQSGSGSALANSFRFFLRSDDNSSVGVAFTNTSLLDNNYHHLVVSFTAAPVASSSTVTAYVDGVAQSMGTYAVRAVTTSSNFSDFDFSPLLGALNNRGALGTNSAMSGTFDEFALFNTALTPSQVLTHYNAVPEPSASWFLGLAITGLVIFRRRKDSHRYGSRLSCSK